MSNRIEVLLQAKNGGNQSEMARFIGVTPQAVQKWIAGESEPRGKNLELAAAFLGVSQAELKFGKDGEDAHLQLVYDDPVSRRLMGLLDEAGDEVRLLTVYRLASPEDKLAIDAAVAAVIQRLDIVSILNKKKV
jgi:transcriptional regulator with XRE-family HTH domain